MRSYKLFEILIVNFLLLFIAILLNTSEVQAVTISNGPINDGISQWYSGSSNRYSTVPLSKNMSIGYAFGSAQSKGGKVTSSNDSTITDPSTMLNSNNATTYSKMNIFLQNLNNNDYISSTFQMMSKSLSDTDRLRGVSATSPDFMITKPYPTGTTDNKTYSILSGGTTSVQIGSSNYTTGLLNKKYYYHLNSSGTPDAYKITGNFVRGNDYNLQVELLLRPSPNNPTIIQRELFLSNQSGKVQNFQIFFGEDTDLGDLSLDDYNSDNVPVYDLGNKTGIYVKQSSYKLAVSNTLKDGFTHYSGEEMSYSGMHSWAASFDSKGNGQEAQNNPANTRLTGNMTNSAYAVSWDPTTLQNNQTAHYASQIGVTSSPFAIPDPQKTYTNLSSSDGKNHVGNTLQFTLKMTNHGFNSSWAYHKLVDTLEKGLQYQPNSVKINGTSVSDSGGNVVFNNSDNTLTISPGLNLSDEQSATITFDATITNDASGQTLKNVGQFYGRDSSGAHLDNDTETKADVEIPVEVSPFKYNFTKTVQNITKNTPASSTSTDAENGNKIQYIINFNVLNGSTPLAADAKLTDALPKGLTFDSATLKTGTTTQTVSSLKDLDIGTLSANQAATLTINATVSATNAGIIANTATMSNVKSSTLSLGSIVSNEVDLNIADVESFKSVPTNIDFGQINSSGDAKIIKNVQTHGGLQVIHTNSGKYSVNVAYDNSNGNKRMRTDSGVYLNADANSNPIFIRQRNSSPNDLGSWVAITKSGIPIQQQSFSSSDGINDLSNYVGVGDWQLNIPADTKAGAYHGTLTWSINDVPQN